jgi:hypothetical protein
MNKSLLWSSPCRVRIMKPWFEECSDELICSERGWKLTELPSIMPEDVSCACNFRPG